MKRKLKIKHNIEDCYFKEDRLNEKHIGSYLLCKFDFKHCEVVRFNTNVHMYELRCNKCKCFSPPGKQVYVVL